MALSGPRRRLALAVLLGMALVVAAVGGAVAADFLRSGKVVKAMKVATDDGTWSTNQTTWVAIPKMSFSTTVPSGEQGLFLATFSAHGVCASTSSSLRACQIRVLMDGLVVVPGSVSNGVPFEVVTNQFVEGMRSMQFLAGPIGPGTHNWVVQARVNGNGVIFALHEKTFSVLRSSV